MGKAVGRAIDAVSNWANDHCGDEPKYDAEWAHRPKTAPARKGLFRL